MKKENTKRSLRFIGITVLCGTVLIFLLFTFESNPFKESDLEIPLHSMEQELRDEINGFTQKNPFTPADFPNILTKINSASKQGLIKTSTENELVYQLTSDYKQKSFNLCENFLVNCSNDEYDSYIEMLNNLEKRMGKDRQIDFYRKQIATAYMYDILYPAIINAYVVKEYNTNFLNFSHNDNCDIAERIANPDLDSKYLPSRNTALTGMRKKLRDLASDAYSAGITTSTPCPYYPQQ